MPFFVTYEMLTGKSGTGVQTALEAIDLYRALRAAGSGAIEIRDENGKVYSFGDLLTLAAPSKGPPSKPRAGA